LQEATYVTNTALKLQLTPDIYFICRQDISTFSQLDMNPDGSSM
jgi:hypothetical protein